MIYLNDGVKRKPRKVMKCDPVTKSTLKIYNSITEAAKDIAETVGGKEKSNMDAIQDVANNKRKLFAGFSWAWKPLEKFKV